MNRVPFFEKKFETSIIEIYNLSTTTNTSRLRDPCSEKGDLNWDTLPEKDLDVLSRLLLSGLTPETP